MNGLKTLSARELYQNGLYACALSGKIMQVVKFLDLGGFIKADCIYFNERTGKFEEVTVPDGRLCYIDDYYEWSTREISYEYH